MRLRTLRLDLEPFVVSDLASFHALSTEPGVRRYLWDDEVITLDRAREALEASDRLWTEKGYGLFAIRVRDAAPLVGYAGLWDMPGHPDGELLYALGTTWWGRGYATEASVAIMRDAVSRLGLREVIASTDPPNVASIRVMQRLGMELLRREVIGGLDTVFYRIAASAIPSE